MRTLLITIICLFTWACQTDSDIKTKDVSFFPASSFAQKIPEKNLLQRILAEKKLVVVTRNNPTSYYLDRSEQPAGFEYDLAKGFADSLGVELEVITASNTKEMIPLLAHGKAHFAAAGLSVTRHRKKLLRFSEPYQFVTSKLVYRLGTRRPSDLSHIGSGLEVPAHSAHIERLNDLRNRYPGLNWAVSYNNGAEELLSMVWSKVINYTIVDSNELALHRRYFPELRVAFDVSDPSPVAWAFPPSLDRSLYNAANAYLDGVKNDGSLNEILERYFGHTRKFDYVGAIKFLEHSHSRLPRYLTWFKRAARQHGLDWHLLAAVGYQESHWDPSAVSPTGVRGLMMLTRRTARAMRVSNRRDPKQSIFGGAKLLQEIYTILPRSVEDHDRTWMALAAYNVGYGHLMDARKITAQRGGNPDKWIDVRNSLPLLTQEKWYSRTRYGYARGHEPVVYVDNIRRYYDTLSWMSEKQDFRNRMLALAQID